MTRDDEAKGSRELEQEVEQHRSAVEQTLAELIERFSPQQLLRQFLNQSEGERQQPRQLMQLMASNPVPTLVAAAGLGWLLMSQSRPSETGRHEVPWDEPSHASYGVDPDYDPRSGSGHVALEKSELEMEAEEYYKSEHYGDKLGNQVSSMLGNQPLLVAAFGMVVGGLLGAALPRMSRHEVGFSDRLEDFDRSSREYGGKADELADEPGSSRDQPTRH